jgi:hypothetical protein
MTLGATGVITSNGPAGSYPHANGRIERQSASGRSEKIGREFK